MLLHSEMSSDMIFFHKYSPILGVKDLQWSDLFGKHSSLLNMHILCYGVLNLSEIEELPEFVVVGFGAMVTSFFK